MNNIPTAEEIALKVEDVASYEELQNPIIFASLVAKEFAKLHVKAALEAASENTQMIGVTQHDNDAPDIHSDFVYVVDSNGPDYGYTVNKESILNAYLLDNIK